MPSPTPSPPGLAPFSLGLHAALDSLRLRLDASTPSSPLPSLLSPPITTLTHLLHTSLTSPATPARSALLLGPSSSGKSLILTRSLALLRTRHSLTPLVLTLHGLLHPTPTSAWRSLSSQLSAHLRLPSAPAPPRHMESQGLIRAAFARLRESRTPILLVLDQLHLFATDPLAQHVLYALLNLLQDPALCAACVAMSPHLDVEDALEKRVRSRFAPMQLVVPLPNHPQAVLRYLRAVVATPEPDLRKQQPRPAPAGEEGDEGERADVTSSDDDERAARASRRSARARGRVRKRASKKRRRARVDVDACETSDDAVAEAEFERGVRELDAAARALVEAPALARLVARHLERTRVVAPLLRAFDGGLVAAFGGEVLCGAEMGRVGVGERVGRAVKGMEEMLFPGDALAETMRSLSVVELGLLVALRRVERGGGMGVTFGRVFEMYKTLGRGEEGLLAGDDGEVVASREVAEKSWERVVEGGLVAREGMGPRHTRTVRLNVEAEEVDGAVQEHQLASTRLKRWARASVRR